MFERLGDVDDFFDDALGDVVVGMRFAALDNLETAGGGAQKAGNVVI